MTASNTTTVHIPYTIERDEDGTWCANAWLGSSGAAHGNGGTRETAISDLRRAVQMVLDEDGVPEQLMNSLEIEIGSSADPG